MLITDKLSSLKINFDMVLYSYSSKKLGVYFKLTNETKWLTQFQFDKLKKTHTWAIN